MQLESEWVKTPLNQTELLQLLSDLEQLKTFMPEHGKGFSVLEDQKSCRIKVTGFPMDIHLNMETDPVKDGYLRLKSVGMPIDFAIEIHPNAQGEVQVRFLGQSINVFMRPVIQPAVQQFLQSLAKNIDKHFSKDTAK